jgi:ssDNA thymidine ADP-ribosyltransferase, DarT
MLHLEADVREVVAWANSHGRRWAFSNGNAGTRYTQFFSDIRQFGQLDWKAIGATDWRDPIVRERKQAEFLVQQSFPWELVRRIGVIDAETADGVTQVCDAARHRPKVVVEPNWYY